MRPDKALRRAALVLALAGCAPLPPAAPPPETSAPALERTLAQARREPAFAPAEETGTAWWRSFADPQLDDLVETALADHPSMAAAEARIAAARQQERLAGLQGDIRYGSGASVIRQHLSENGLFPPPLGGSTLNQGDVSVGAAYTLDWWGKNRALLQAAVGETRAAEAEREAARLLLAGEVADAYFVWQEATARLQLAQRGAALQRANLALAERRSKRGLASPLPARQMESLLAGDEERARDLAGQAEIQRHRLAALAGKGPDWADHLAEPAHAANGPFPLPSHLPLDWLARRPDVVALKWRAEAAAQRVGEARAEFYPNLDLGLLVGLQSIDLERLLSAGSWYGSFGPALHIPLFNVQSLTANLGTNEALYAEAAARYREGLVAAAAQVADALSRAASLDRQEKLQRGAVISAERALRIETARFEAGLADRQPALEGEIALLAQRAREVQLQAERRRAMAGLFQALGGGYATKQE